MKVQNENKLYAVIVDDMYLDRGYTDKYFSTEQEAKDYAAKNNSCWYFYYAVKASEINKEDYPDIKS